MVNNKVMSIEKKIVAVCSVNTEMGLYLLRHVLSADLNTGVTTTLFVRIFLEGFCL